MYFNPYIELMIAYLRSQVSATNSDNSIQNIQNPFFFQNTAPTFNYDGPSISINHSAMSNIP